MIIKRKRERKVISKEKEFSETKNPGQTKDPAQKILDKLRKPQCYDNTLPEFRQELMNEFPLIFELIQANFPEKSLNLTSGLCE